MIRRRNLGAVLRAATIAATLSLLASSMVVVPVATAAGSHRPVTVDAKVLAKPTSGIVVATGRLLDAMGKPTAGMVAALAWPNEDFLRTLGIGDAFQRPTVGWARAGDDGRFKLKVDAKLVTKPFHRSDGQLDIEIVAWSSDRQGALTTSTWVSDDARARGHHEIPSVAIRLTSTLTTYDERARVDQTAATTTAYGCGDLVLQSTYDAGVVVGETWPWGSHTGNITIETNHELTLGWGTSNSGTYGSWSLGGETSKKTTTGDDYNGLSAAFRDYRLQMRYGKYWLACSLPVYYYEMPMFETGGFWNEALSSQNFPTSWQHCAPAVGTWWRDQTSGSKYILGGGVKIAGILGIDLKLTTAYATTRKLKYYYNGNYHVCGSNDVPSMAAKVRTGT
jgi:hypothetical protein